MSEIIKKSHQTVAFKAVLSANELNLLTLLIRSLKKSATDLREKQKRDYKFKNGVALNDADVDIDIEQLPNSFEYSLTELSETMGVSKQAVSKKTQESVIKMMSRVIKWPLPCGGWELEQLLSKSRYLEGKGLLQLQIHPRTKQAILDETKGVSFVDLSLFMKLKSGYAKRILDMICKFKNNRNFTIQFEEFCETIGAYPSDYKNGLSAFRNSVLDKPLNEIFKSSNGTWSATDERRKGYELVKSGRTVKKIIFRVRYQESEELKNIAKKESLLRENLESQSDFNIAELVAMEASILAIENIDTFNRIMINGYQGTAAQYNYKIPKDITFKINELLLNN